MEYLDEIMRIGKYLQFPQKGVDIPKVLQYNRIITVSDTIKLHKGRLKDLSIKPISYIGIVKRTEQKRRAEGVQK